MNSKLSGKLIYFEAKLDTYWKAVKPCFKKKMEHLKYFRSHGFRQIVTNRSKAAFWFNAKVCYSVRFCDDFLV